MRSSRLWSLLLLPGGLATGHALGYATARWAGSAPSIPGGHGYLEVVFCLAVPCSLMVLGKAMLSGSRFEGAPARFAMLAPIQVSLFAAIEVAQHVAAGIGPATSLREASFVFGVLAQLFVAWAVCALVRATTQVVAHVVRRRRHLRADIPSESPTLPTVATIWSSPAAVAFSSLSRRGPPLVRSGLPPS